MEGNIPSDLEILEDIYYRYHKDFRKYAKKDPDRIARIRVPIEVEDVAEACGVEEDMIFGRIFYHFNKNYSYTNTDGEVTSFFSTEKFEGLSVNFPLVASVLADKYDEKKKYETILLLVAIAVVISIVSLLVAFFV
ncbi:hypothetical protein [Fodinibius salsisoli]|uniref:Helix-turn-helix domain-containing protein n=1 Tax=Fodinibius salsisoli TaxID=2820877 RepID=A0ABT3PHJ2_9BACT|nr:hypothetical protein [Fodinibius salsisoli]MCW9705386.1 hypothetical protein [Fodinibius salsisoli]